MYEFPLLTLSYLHNGISIFQYISLSPNWDFQLWYICFSLGIPIIGISLLTIPLHIENSYAFKMTFLYGNWPHLVFWEGVISISLQWHHNEHHGAWNHQPHDCLLDCLFWRRSKNTSKLCVTGLREGNSLVTGEFLAQRASNAENVYIWWHHHEIGFSRSLAEFIWYGEVNQLKSSSRGEMVIWPLNMKIPPCQYREFSLWWWKQ